MKIYDKITINRYFRDFENTASKDSEEYNKNKNNNNNNENIVSRNSSVSNSSKRGTKSSRRK